MKNSIVMTYKDPNDGEIYPVIYIPIQINEWFELDLDAFKKASGGEISVCEANGTRESKQGDKRITSSKLSEPANISRICDECNEFINEIAPKGYCNLGKMCNPTGKKCPKKKVSYSSLKENEIISEDILNMLESNCDHYYLDREIGEACRIYQLCEPRRYDECPEA